MNTNIEIRNGEFATKASASRFGELLKTYEAMNAEKNRLTRECKPMTNDIKDTLSRLNVSAIEVGGYSASVSVTAGSKLNEAAIAAYFADKGGIPAAFYTPTSTTKLVVRKSAQGRVKVVA